MKQIVLKSGNRTSISALTLIMMLLFIPADVLGQSSWKSATTKAEFSKRSDFKSVVFDNKMWVLNGAGSKRDLVCDTNIISFHDTWYSTTGATWNRAADSVQYPIATMFVALVFNEFMWVVGGHQGC